MKKDAAQALYGPVLSKSLEHSLAEFVPELCEFHGSSPRWVGRWSSNCS
jgi:hypothetical protein